MNKKAMLLHASDNSAVAVEDILKDETVEIVCKGEVTKNIVAKADIPFGFKVSTEDTKENSNILKYGQVIGMASCPVAQGDRLHVENIKGLRA